MYFPVFITLPAGEGCRWARKTTCREFRTLAPTFVTDTIKFVTIGHQSCAELIKHRFASLQSKKSSLNSRNCSYHQRKTFSCFLIGFCDCPYSGLYSFKQGLIQKSNADGPYTKQFPSSVSRSHYCSLKTDREDCKICRQYDRNVSPQILTGRQPSYVPRTINLIKE